MSKNITVIPEKYNMFGMHHRLAFDRADYDRYDILKEYAVPISTSETELLENYDTNEQLHTDCYGDILTIIRVDKFIEIYEVADLTDWDKGIISFLKCLDQSQQLMLYYH